MSDLQSSVTTHPASQLIKVSYGHPKWFVMVPGGLLAGSLPAMVPALSLSHSELGPAADFDPHLWPFGFV